MEEKEPEEITITILQSVHQRLLDLHQYGRDLLFVPIHFLLVIMVLLTILLIVLFFYLHYQLLGGNPITYWFYENSSDFLSYKPYFNPNMTYYVCSYGGSGSYMLRDYLKNFGKVEHIHSRNPPSQLEYVGGNHSDKQVYGEWFNGVEIPESELGNYKVIYLYKDPVKAIYSRFYNPDHLLHVECDTTITLEQVIQSKKDLYGLEEFFDHYTKKVKKGKKKRNYPIYCVKYEEFWDHIPEFNKVLGLPTIPTFYPVKKETPRKEPYSKILYKIYHKLLKKMKKKKWIEIS
jgi:hypothetical protein